MNWKTVEEKIDGALGELVDLSARIVYLRTGVPRRGWEKSLPHRAKADPLTEESLRRSLDQARSDLDDAWMNRK